MFHRNSCNVATLPDWCKQECLELCFPNCGLENGGKRSDNNGVFDLATKWLVGSAFPCRGMRIATVIIIIICMRVLSSEIGFVCLLKALQKNFDVCKTYLSWTQFIGRHCLGPDVEEVW